MYPELPALAQAPPPLGSSHDPCVTEPILIKLSVGAIVLVPAWLAVMGTEFGQPKPMGTEHTARVLAPSFFLSLSVGMLIR